MTDSEAVALVAEDLRIWVENRRPGSREPLAAAYLSALGVVLELRKVLNNEAPGGSLLAMLIEREDELIGTARVLARLRAVAKAALERGLDEGTRAALEAALS